MATREHFVNSRSTIEHFGGVPFNANQSWFEDLSVVLDNATPYCRVCWAKTAAGGWTTTSRMHEEIRVHCIFGCSNMPDYVRQYIICLVLWSTVAQVLNYSGSVFLERRLLLSEPTHKDLIALTMALSVYHSLKNDFESRAHIFGVQEHGSLPWNIIQARAVGFARGVFAILRV